ncbi:hypothetical protein, partial [Thalassobaculum sp.]|uniref:hypothetical protein n=1 Tax=Thalassobaculum sp. TaxID=2022740 RepID=UPI0032EC85AE
FAQGVVFVPFCYTAAGVSSLPVPAVVPFGMLPVLKFAAARLERADGAATTPDTIAGHAGACT